MFIYLDTETTGSGSEDRLCQIAFKTDTGTTVDELFNPEIPINDETKIGLLTQWPISQINF